VQENKILWKRLKELVSIHLQTPYIVADCIFCMLGIFMIQYSYEFEDDRILNTICKTSYVIPSSSREAIRSFSIDFINSILDGKNINPTYDIGIMTLSTDTNNYNVFIGMMKLLYPTITQNNHFFLLKGLQQENMLIPHTNQATDYNFPQNNLIYVDHIQSEVTIIECKKREYIESLQGSCAHVESSNYPCTFCKAYVEFYHPQARECQTCTILNCLEDEEVEICCGTSDTSCVKKNDVNVGQCRNGQHDYGEQCDPTDNLSSLQKCCHNDCTIKTGFYSTPACSTVCGDGIVAGEEECDNFSSDICDLFTCKLIEI
jgi:hypothetical protein